MYSGSGGGIELCHDARRRRNRRRRRSLAVMVWRHPCRGWEKTSKQFYSVASCRLQSLTRWALRLESISCLCFLYLMDVSGFVEATLASLVGLDVDALAILPVAIALKCFRSGCVARPFIRVYTLVPFFFLCEDPRVGLGIMGVVHRVAVASHTTGYRCKEATIDGGQCVWTCLHEQLLLDATFGYSCYCSTFLLHCCGMGQRTLDRQVLRWIQSWRRRTTWLRSIVGNAVELCVLF